MRLLLDTHAVLWWAYNHRLLSETAYAAIADATNEVFVSAVSAMEIATKHRLGRLGFAETLAVGFAAEITTRGFGLLSIDCDHALRAGSLSGDHRDPWDRLLCAQALVEGMTLVSNDSKLAAFGVDTLW